MVFAHFFSLSQGFTDDQLVLVEQNTVMVEERERDIQQIVQSISDLNEIFRDLAGMVVEQVSDFFFLLLFFFYFARECFATEYLQLWSEDYIHSLWTHHVMAVLDLELRKLEEFVRKWKKKCLRLLFQQLPVMGIGGSWQLVNFLDIILKYFAAKTRQLIS